MQARRNLLKFSLGVDMNCRLDAPALKCATHCPEALASLLLHAVDCLGNHCLVMVVQLVVNALSLCLQKLQVYSSTKHKDSCVSLKGEFRTTVNPAPDHAEN